jgi:membrane protein required for colicin V production
MSGVDIVIIGIFIISIIVGILRGLIKEALSVTSWILAIWLAATFNTAAGDWFSQFVNIPNATFRSWIGFSLVFVGTLFVFALITYVVTKLLVRGPIKGVDRFLGTFFGAARAGLIIVALVILLRGLGFAESEWWEESNLLGYFVPTADFIEPLVFDKLPESVKSTDSLERQVLDRAVENLSEESDIPVQNSQE